MIWKGSLEKDCNVMEQVVLKKTTYSMVTVGWPEPAETGRCTGLDDDDHVTDAKILFSLK